MTRLWWVRHGPTHARGMIGWTDLPADLSDAESLRRLSRYLPNAPVISSDLVRAAATADALCGDRPRLPHDRDLRELHFGDWESRHHDEVASPELTAFYDRPGDISAPGGESWNQCCTRVCAAADRLAAAHEGGEVIVVSHMGAILTQVQRALRLPARRIFAQKIDNLSVTCLTLGDGWTADPINHRP